MTDEDISIAAQMFFPEAKAMNPARAQTDVSKGVLKAIRQPRSNPKARTVKEALGVVNAIVDKANHVVQWLLNDYQGKYIAVRALTQGAATPSSTKWVSRSTRSPFQ